MSSWNFPWFSYTSPSLYRPSSRSTRSFSSQKDSRSFTLDLVQSCALFATQWAWFTVKDLAEFMYTPTLRGIINAFKIPPFFVPGTPLLYPAFSFNMSKMKCRHSIKVWLALLVTTMKVVQAVNVCQGLTESKCLELYHSCEKALEKAANNTDKQFELQRAFYPPDSETIPVESVRIKVSAAVNTMPEGNCRWGPNQTEPAFTNSSRCTSYCWSNTEGFEWSANSNVRSHMKLQTLVDNLAYYLTFIQAILHLILKQETSSISESHLNLELEIEELPCMPSQEQFARVLASALTWVSQPCHSQS